MLSEAELVSMRTVVNVHLPDRCSIASRSEPTLNKTTGAYSEGDETAVYEGACRIRPAGQRGDLVVQAGGEPITLRTYDCSVPWDASGVKVDDIVTVSASSDPELVGRPLRVRDVQYGSWQLVRRLVLEDDLG